MDAVKELILIAPWATPGMPIILIFLYYTKIRNDFESKNITVDGLKELLSKVSIHLPNTLFVALENEKTSVGISEILKDEASNTLLKVIQRQESLKSRVDFLTRPVVGTCSAVFIIMVIFLIGILHPQGSSLGVVITTAIFLSVFFFILLYHWDGQVKLDMEILRNHVDKTPAVKK